MNRLYKLPLLAALLALLAFPASAQEVQFEEVLPCRYESVNYAGEGMIEVRENGLSGYTDMNGAVVVEPQYWGRHFQGGLNLVQNDSMYAVIDRTGAVVFPFTPDYEAAFAVWDAASQELDYRPKEWPKPLPLPAGYEYVLSVGHSHVLARDTSTDPAVCHLFDQDGNRVNNYEYSGGSHTYSGEVPDGTEAGDSCAQLFTRLYRSIPAEVDSSIHLTVDTPFDVYDHNGRLTFTGFGDYYYAGPDPGPYDDEIHLVAISGARGLMKEGAVDGHGRIRIATCHSDVQIVDDNLLLVQHADRNWASTFDGEPLTGEYGGMQYLGDGLIITSIDGLHGIIAPGDEIILPFEYENLRVTPQGLIVAQQGGRVGIINSAGEVLLPFVYDDISPLTLYGHRPWWECDPGLLAVQQGGRYGLLRAVYDPADQPSEWARGEVVWATQLELVPEGLQSAYRSPITRAEFCALAVAALEQDAGMSVQRVLTQRGLALQPDLYSDCDDPNVLAASALGVVQGMGGGSFAPDATITREQAAALLCNLRSALGRPLDAAEEACFADHSEMGDWVREAVSQAVAAGLIRGVGGNRFDPTGLLTREQAILMLRRAALD